MGKTFVSVRLLKHLQQSGSAVGFKPVSAGAAPDNPNANEDALLLAAASKPPISVDECNPLFYDTPAAPLFSAMREGKPFLSLADTHQQYLDLAARYDHVIVEGAGGWLAPIAPDVTVETLAQHLGLPVILVVGLRLGSLNHALLSERAMRGVKVAGWIANNIGDLQGRDLDDHLEFLKANLDAPCLGFVDADTASFDAT